jgi:hypothetical protein
MFDGRSVRVHFRVKAELVIGQTVGVCTYVSNFEGELIDNVEWKVTTLVTTPECYPVWYTANSMIVPHGHQVAHTFDFRFIYYLNFTLVSLSFNYINYFEYEWSNMMIDMHITSLKFIIHDMLKKCIPPISHL